MNDNVSNDDYGDKEGERKRRRRCRGQYSASNTNSRRLPFSLSLHESLKSFESGAPSNV